MTTAAAPLMSVRERGRLATLVEHPLRLAILQAATTPRSASEIAAGLGVARQRVNYHVGRLRRAGFLVPAGQRQRRGFVEQRYSATAQGYVVDPAALGPMGARADLVQDRFSADYLLALSAQMQGELGQVMDDATRQRKRVATLSLSADVRFTGPEQRAQFARALQRAVTKVIGRYAVPAAPTRSGRQPAAGRLFRLVVACYPPPRRP